MSSVDLFIKEYFAEIRKINDFHYNFLKQNNFEFPKVDYFQIYDFINTATNFLLEIEPHLLGKLGAKMYEDIKSLHNYYQRFYKKTEYNHLVFYGEYLETLQEYNDLKKQYEKLKVEISKYNDTIKRVENELKIKTEKDENYKKLKKTYVDSIYELSRIKENFEKIRKSLKEIEEREKLAFIDKFDKEKEFNLLKLKKIISTKIYYYETLLWYLASKSASIKKFFDDSDIQGEFSTKTFIKYFLKNVDISKTSNSGWFNYLNTLLKVL